MIQIIASITSNGVIGKDNKYVIVSEEYLRWLEEEVQGTKILVGKVTKEEAVLPEEIYKNEYEVIETPDQLKYFLDNKNKEDLSILGGETLFKAFINYADEIKIAEYDGYYLGDKYFPKFNTKDYEVTIIKDLEDPKALGVIKKYKKRGTATNEI